VSGNNKLSTSEVLQTEIVNESAEPESSIARTKTVSITTIQTEDIGITSVAAAESPIAETKPVSAITSNETDTNHEPFESIEVAQTIPFFMKQFLPEYR
jgi:hypothetical protein